MSVSVLSPSSKLPSWAVRQSGLREVIRQFTPNWFTATMGTGILSLALNQLPAPVPGLHQVAIGLWLFNIVLFATFTALYTAR